MNLKLDSNITYEFENLIPILRMNLKLDLNITYEFKT